MARMKLLSVVKTVRLRYAVPFVLLMVAVYWMGARGWLVTWPV